MSARRASVGVFRLDQSLVIQSWDAWMAEATGISESIACGRPLTELFPDIIERGMVTRLRRVADGLGVDVLAPAFHKYLIACPPRDRASRFERMRQLVTLTPLRTRDGVSGVIVTIEDVTARLDREKRLAAELDSLDEVVRLRAAKALAADNESPALLADALADRSWRVRRVAAEAMAHGGGREVVATLVDVVREHHRDPGLLNAALVALAQTQQDVQLEIAALLESADPDVRTYAALSLGLLNDSRKDSRPVSALIARLADDDMNVRYHAIEALGRIGDRAAAEPLAAVAETGDFFLGFAALDALAAIGEPSVAPRVLSLLEDEFLRPAAAACIGALGAEDVAVPLAQLTLVPGVALGPIALALAEVFDRMEDEFGEGQLVADLAAGAMTAESAQTLTAAMDSANDEELRALVLVLSWLPFAGVDQTLASLLRREHVRAFAAERLSHRGIAAAPFIETVARDADDELKTAAALALARIGSERSVPTLVEWLRGDATVVIAAASALAAIGDRRGFVPLLAVMDSPEAAVRQAAVSALNSIGHPDMEAAMVERLDSESSRIRESAARVAGYFGYRGSLARMMQLCGDPDETVRRAAVESLANFEDRSAWRAIIATIASDTNPTVRAAAARALGYSSSHEALHALVRASEDVNLWVRYYSARALARREDAHANVLACLAERATRDTAVPVRIAAVEALGALAAGSMTDVLVSLARDPETDVACAALTALGLLDAAATAAPLMAALDGDDNLRCHAALDALGRQRAAGAVDAIRTMARATRDDTLREHAVRTLGAMRHQRATSAIVALADDRRLRSIVIAVLSDLDETQLPWLRDELAHVSDTTRGVIVEALGRMRHAGASHELAYLLDDPTSAVRLAAARALGRLDLRDARAQLAALARTDENPAVRRAAQDALARG